MPEHFFEILAPAGDETMLRAAVFSGADSVYLGIDGFNARRGAANFSGDSLLKAVCFCHARNCKVYAALNTVLLPGEEDAIASAITQAATAGCDALIVQDLATAEIAKQIAPNLPLHASTQTSVHSLAGVLEMEKLGFSRVILSRELSLQEIADIAAQSPIELEVFVHGALCVSVSGQCYMSSFFGGRSANRGVCAGPCRLPFQASLSQEVSHAPANGTNHLSLKDLSIIDELPTLREIGVVSAKIEGRLRGPEYCAVAVDAARKALANEPYDKKLLRDVFSRNGFTNSWYAGTLSSDIFGVRTEQDTANSKTALPKARELYRREMPRVEISLTLELNQQGATLTATDGTNSVQKNIVQSLPIAQNDLQAALETALSKTGGTPFHVKQITLHQNGLFLAAAQAGALRRDALEELLVLRETPTPYKINPFTTISNLPIFSLLKNLPSITKTKPHTFTTWFEHVAQLPANAEFLCDFFVLPLWEAEQVPESLRSKTWLWIPRILFGKKEEKAKQAIEKNKAMGFKGYELQNIAHLYLCQGLPMRSNFGLNIANSISAARIINEGCSTVMLSPELSLQQIKTILALSHLQEKANFSILGYGNMPLMVTRACPVRNITDCATCKKQGYLTDRKGMKMPLLCRDDVRTILNPIPLWMADRISEIPTTDITLYFTTENKEQTQDILSQFSNQQKYQDNYTRGLYYQKQFI